MSTPAGEPGQGLFGVPADPRGQGCGVRERPRQADLLQETDRDLGPVERAVEVEEQRLDAERMGPEGGVGADAGDGPPGPSGPDGLGDEDPGRQDLVRGLEVGRREAQEPASAVPADDPAADLVGPAQQPSGFLHPAALEQAADGGRADDAAAEDDGGHDAHPDPGPPAEPLQRLGVAPPAPAEAEAPADDDLAGAEAVP